MSSNTSCATSLESNLTLLGCTTWANHSNKDNASEAHKLCKEAAKSFSDSWDIIIAVTPILILTAFVLGLLLNLVVLLVNALHRGKKTVADVYVTNFTVAELLLVVTLPFWAETVKRNFSWPFGDFLCRVTNAVLYVNKYASVFFLAAVSLDQHQVICRTMEAHAQRNVSRARFWCVALWLVSLLLSLPVVIYRRVRALPEHGLPAMCFLDYPSPTWSVVNGVLLDLLGFVLPFTLIGVCGFRIRRHLLRSRLQTRSGSKLSATGAPRQDLNRAVVAVSTVVVGFFVCWFPFHLNSGFRWLLNTGLLGDSCWWKYLWNSCNLVSTFFGFLNSCINPALYLTAGKSFQRKALEVFSCHRGRKPGSRSTGSNSVRAIALAGARNACSQASSSM